MLQRRCFRGSRTGMGRGLTIAAEAAVLAAMVLLPACGDNGGGAVKHAAPTFKNFGVVVVADDGNGFSNGLQVIQIEDTKGKALATPTQKFFPIANASDLDGQSITPDGTHGAAVDGGNLVYFFESDLKNGTITLSPTTIDVTAYGGDGDSIASLPNGDEVVVSAGGDTTLAQISGVLSGTPVIAEDIATSNQGEYDGLVISEDGKVMLSRTYGGVLDVYSIKKVAPHPGSHGGTISYDFTLAKTISSGLPSLCCDGREGMAISPVNSSRAVLAGSDGTVVLLTGLPDNPTVASTLALPSGANAVTISRDGKYAIVATSGGLFVVQGITGGTLSQLGGAYSPTFPIPEGEGTCQLSNPETLGVTFDGKYIATIQYCGLTESDTNVGSGVLLTVPFSKGALADPVGQLNYVVAPNNNQLLTH